MPTAESAGADLEAPSLRERLSAFALDYLVVLAYLVLLAAVGSVVTLGRAAEGRALDLPAGAVSRDLLAYLVSVLPVTLYFALAESSASGATLGKRRVGLRVVRARGGALSRGRSLLRSVLKFLPWQLAHTCLFHIPGWPLDPEEPPRWVIAGFVITWLLVLATLVSLGVGRTRRTPYDWLAATRVVRARSGKEGHSLAPKHEMRSRDEHGPDDR